MSVPVTIYLLRKLDEELGRPSVDFRKIEFRVRELLEYLVTQEGRTDENCKFVDQHLSEKDGWADLNLPDHLHDILADMSSTLHDAISAPKIAENFESTPEQLLARLDD